VARRYSPYSSQYHRPSRWPKILLFLLLVAIAGLAGAIVGGGQSPSSIYDDVRDRVSSALDRDDNENDPGIAPTQSAGAAQPTQDGTIPNQAGQSVTQTAATATPVPLNLDPNGPFAAASKFGELWSAADYDGLYDLLTANAQTTISRADFVDRYAGIAAESGIYSVAITPGQELSGTNMVPVTVTFNSHYVGEFTQENSFPYTKEGDTWKLNWTPSLIFAGLAEDCVDYTADANERGSILDRNRKPLASNSKISQIGVIPGQITDEKTLLKKLSDLLDMPQDEIKAKYEDAEPEWFVPIKNYPEEMDSATLNGLQGLNGVVVQSAIARVYPLGKAAAHVTGYVTPATADDIAADTSGALLPDQPVGRAGVEASANDILAGVTGGRLRVVGCGNRTEKTLIAKKDTVAGRDVILTIDSDFQKSVDAAMTADKGMEKGSAVILEPETGAVLALVSHPTYDPNWFVLGFNDADWTYVNDEDQRPLFNRATEATYPTGSIFKVITMSAGMADLGYDGDTEFDCTSSWTIPGTEASFDDWTVDYGQSAQGRMTLHNALVNSCNTIFYQVGYALDEKDSELLPDMAKAFGLGRVTGIPYFYEAAGAVPSPEWKQSEIGDFWASGDAVNLSIGQGYLLATPLQMAVAYAAIANGGEVLQPFLIEYTADHETGKRSRLGKKTVVNDLPLSGDQVAEIQSAMRDQTSNAAGAGSARIFGAYDYPIAGKTGTAQNNLDGDDTPHSWFASFGPYGDTATITTIVMAENAGEGVTVAAPITKAIYDAYRKIDFSESG
jgi:penicillin-binding protein 2